MLDMKADFQVWELNPQTRVIDVQGELTGVAESGILNAYAQADGAATQPDHFKKILLLTRLNEALPIYDSQADLEAAIQQGVFALPLSRVVAIDLPKICAVGANLCVRPRSGVRLR